jgi:hypothetical protein
MVIPTAGTSTVWINPGGASTGQVTVTVHEVPADLTGTITPGTATTIAIAAVGQNAGLTFTGTAGQRASLRVNTSTVSTGAVRIRHPDGTILGSAGVSPNAFLNALTLPVTGSYTVEVDPSGAATGQVSVTLYVFTDVTDTLTVNGPSVIVTTTLPGQRGLLTFPGAASQPVTIRLSGNTMGGVTIILRKPDGAMMVSSTSNASTFNVPQQTLPVSGSYSVEVDPSGVNVGSITVSVTNP